MENTPYVKYASNLDIAEIDPHKLLNSIVHPIGR